MYFRDIRTVALLSHFNGVIGDDELPLLYELYKSKNPHLKYWDNIEFDLNLHKVGGAHHTEQNSSYAVKQKVAHFAPHFLEKNCVYLP